MNSGHPVSDRILMQVIAIFFHGHPSTDFRKIIICSGFTMMILMCHTIYAQQANIETFLPQLETLAANTETNLDKEDFIKNLDQFARKPLNLNTADAEDLKNLLVLNDRQIANFIRYRQIFGALLNKYELQAIPGWDNRTISLLMPFIEIGPQFQQEFPGKNCYKKGRTVC